MAWSNRVADYVAELRRLGRDQFLAAYPNPVLVHHFGRDAADALARVAASASGRAKFRTDGPRAGAGDPALAGDATDLEAAVHPLRKRPGNPYPDTIMLGRAESNDVVVPYDDLSKLHAYFTRSATGALLVADAGSTNGTWLGGERLGSNASRRVAQRDELMLGEHAFELFDAAALADWLATIA